MILLKAAASKTLAVLQTVIGIVHKRSSMPILSNVLIRRIGDTIQFTASDLEVQIRTTVEVDGDAGDCAITVNADKLFSILHSMPSDQTVTLNSSNEKLIFSGGKSKFTLQTLPALDFPLITEDPGFGAVFSVPQKTLKELLKRVSFAMAVHDIRYYLQGILFVVNDQELTLVATNGHHMALASATLECEFEHQELILPRKTALELQKLLSDDEGAVEVQFAKNQIKFKFGTVEFVSKLIEGKYPDYARVIPKNLTKEFLIDRVTFLRSLQRTQIMTSDKFSGVELTIKAGVMRVSASNAEQEEAVDEIDIATYHGGKTEIGFNVTYLIDALNNMEQETVKMELSESNTSALLTIPDNAHFKYICMPMKV